MWRDQGGYQALYYAYCMPTLAVAWVGQESTRVSSYLHRGQTGHQLIAGVSRATGGHIMLYSKMKCYLVTMFGKQNPSILKVRLHVTFTKIHSKVVSDHAKFNLRNHGTFRLFSNHALATALLVTFLKIFKNWTNCIFHYYAMILDSLKKMR